MGANSTLTVSEIFHSLQGETSLTGIRFSFIRLTGCDLRCTYCDSAHAFYGGTRMSVAEIIATIEPHRTSHVLITGGEPLLQRSTPALAQALRDASFHVSIETHGAAPLDSVLGNARIVMDIKTPGSGMFKELMLKNACKLLATDELKFVITSRADYEWASAQITLLRKNPSFQVREILFSPVGFSPSAPGGASAPELSARSLADWVVEDRLDVRMQVQLHKMLWGRDTIGV